MPKHTTQPSPDYLIGIDLGTTHCVIAYADCNQPLNANNCQIFEITQLTGPGEYSKRPLLPCFRYHPLKGEIDPDDMVLPWDGVNAKLPGEIHQVIIGEWARELGTKSEGRLVNSAKSWLCQKTQDANTAFLPWQGHADVAKISPVHACASFLQHIRMAWNHEHSEALLENQEITITIPASFDESARQLTLAAAQLAGLKNIYLIEEPQAVCYHWFAQHQNQTFSEKLLLICDVGGGTTDFSLVQMTHSNDKPLSLKRIGVGEHLMLGGDNIDWMIAANIQQTMQPKQGQQPKLSQVSQLLQQTRLAKEVIFSENAPESVKVTLLGSGSKLIGKAKSQTLDRDSVHQQVMSGFFPVVSIQDVAQRSPTAIQETGLPFASDPAISRHIAGFLQQHQVVSRKALGMDDTDIATPDAILLNGGIFNSPLIKQQLVDVMSHFSQKGISLLANPEPDLAVAKGAVSYSLARKGIFDKISGGSARSFFLLLNKASDDAKAICLLPKGTEENLSITLENHSFALTLGKPVRFDLVSSTSDHSFLAGDIIDYNSNTIEQSRLTQLPPLLITLQEHSERSVTVKLVATYTDIGTLELVCVNQSPEKTHEQWQLAFATRQIDKPLYEGLPKQFRQAQQLIDNVFGDSKKHIDGKQIKSLRNQLEKLLGKKELWDITLSRALFAELLERHKKRRRSATHERLWFNLTGFTIRPGFGYTKDRQHVQALWPLYQQGLQYKQETQSWIDWWTFWRRASGGLDASQQQALFQDVALFFDSKALTSKKIEHQGKQQSLDDIIKLVASLERLTPAIKSDIVASILARLKKQPTHPTYWWALGRVASSQPAYCMDNRLDFKVIEPVIETALTIPWQKSPHIAFATIMMARSTGQACNRVSHALRDQVTAKLLSSKQPKRWHSLLVDGIEMDELEQKRVFGEALPSGLSLID